jgi:hypothetical protein
LKISKIADYEEDFENEFGIFRDNKLPKDDLYWQIKADVDSK